ncbi:MAG: MerR family transcriptional regulator [Flavobacteriaceae bacterium]
MNRIKSTFSIKNLENISGIKAHTIRIWEKRYNLLQPERTDTNIRRYSLSSLQKLLNITLLYNHGFKISKIASLEEGEIPIMVRDIALKSTSEQVAINALKLAMVNFDYVMFDATYDEIATKYEFDYIFINIFMPLMKELGILWQTGAISPSHEHFITNLVKQKIHIQTELIQRKQTPQENQKVFVLFLPENEIHELGVLFLNYYILSQNFKTIFLGQSLTTESLNTVMTFGESLTFVTYLTVEPNKNEIEGYLRDFQDTILEGTESSLNILGPLQMSINRASVPAQVKLHSTFESFRLEFFGEQVFV